MQRSGPPRGRNWVPSRAHGRRELSWGHLRWHNMGCDFFSLLLRSKSGASWSAPLVHTLTQWLGAAAGADCARLPVRHGGFWKNFLFYVPLRRAIRTWKSGLCLRPRIFQSFGVLGVACGVTSYFRTFALLGSTVDTCSTGGFWRISHIFSVRCTQTRGVYSPFRRMEKCAQLMLRVAVSLCAVRTLSLDIISTSSPCDGVGLTHFASFFALLRLSRS